MVHTYFHFRRDQSAGTPPNLWKRYIIPDYASHAAISVSPYDASCADIMREIKPITRHRFGSR
jgi:hypothetical protein